MEIIAALFFMITLCIGHPTIKDYKTSLYKKIGGLLLISIAVLNLGWDIIIVVDTYSNSPIVNRELISSKLGGIKFVPSIHDMSPQQRKEWIRKQIIAGNLDLRSSENQKECLYNNGIFVQMFGEELFYQYTYDQRRAIIEDSIERYNQSYIESIFYECLSPYNEDGTYNSRKGLGSKWQQYSNLSAQEKVNILESFVNNSSNSLDTMSASELVVFKLKRAFCVFIIILGWGIYTLNSKPPYLPTWKKVIKTLLYILLTISMFAVANIDIFKAFIFLCVEIITMIILLNINLKQETINKLQNYGNQRKINKLNNSKLRESILKVFLSLLLPTILILALLWSKERDIAPWLFFYLPYYLFILCYYEYQIWRNKKPTGLNILMVPMLNRIGLYNGNNEQFDFRKKLLLTIMPAILCSILLPLIASLVYVTSGWRAETACHILLTIPIIVWIIALAYSYSFNWLQSAKDNNFTE